MNAFSTSDYILLKRRVIEAGYANEIDWAQSVKAPSNADAFFSEAAWVIINSGMKNQVAQMIWDRVQAALHAGKPVFSAFKHPGKAAAIQHIFDNRDRLFKEFNEVPADAKLAWLIKLPWIGPITQYHLAKNYGVDCAKPDRHLVRITSTLGESVDQFCARLAKATGDRVATVDLVIWRAANLGLI